MPYTDNPYYAKALRFIEETDLAALPPGNMSLTETTCGSTSWTAR